MPTRRELLVGPRGPLPVWRSADACLGQMMRRHLRWARHVLVVLAGIYAATWVVLQRSLQRHALPDGGLDATRFTSFYNRTYTIAFAKPSPGYVVDRHDLWEAPDAGLPPWMRDYFRWHKEQRRTLDRSTRLLVMSCLPHTRRCGGTADRLASLPFMVLVAAMFHRVLLVQWGRPAELQAFLLPPVGGVDWRVPAALRDFVVNDDTVSQTVKTSYVIMGKAPHDQNVTVLRTVFQANDKGSGIYNTYRPGGDNEPDFFQVFHPLWHVMFTPAPPVATLIHDTMKQSRLVPGHYVAIHLRALYNVNTRDDTLVQHWARTGVDCASALATSPHFYFASDSVVASEEAVRYGRAKGISVAAGHEEQEPLHLDSRENWRERPPSAYFGSFRDVYLMSMGRCVAHGIGSFGKFASMMSNNVSCAIQYHYQRSVSRSVSNCTYQPPPPATAKAHPSLDRMFRAPMSDAV